MNQQEQSTASHSVERGDELSLIQLWKVLINYKLLIVSFTVITTLGAIYITSTLPTIYKVKVLMLPASGGVATRASGGLGGLADIAGISLGGNAGAEGEQALARLRTRSFLANHIKEKKLKPILFADQWSEKEKQWTNQEPSNRKASEFLLDMITTSMNSKDKAGLVSLLLEWENPINPNKIADIANSLVSSMNFHAKQRAIVEAKKSISFLEKELEHTSILNSQTILYSMIEDQMQKIMLANVRDEFVFKVIDPAYIPTHAENKPIFVIIFIGMILGIFVGSFFAVSVNYIQARKDLFI